MVRKVLVAVVLGVALSSASTAVAAPSAAMKAIMAAHPNGQPLQQVGAPTPIVTPQYVYGQAFCYSAVEQYVLGVAGGLAQEGLWVRPVWCAIPGLPPHIYSLDNSYRYQVCTGLIQCAGGYGPFLANGGNGYRFADYEWIGNFRWSTSGINASAQVHMAWELQEDGTNWSWGWT